MTAADPQLTILVPCHDEGARVPALAAAWRAWQATHPAVASELLCVDDGSRDDTAARLAAEPDVRVASLEGNRGKGAALRAGMAVARGGVVLCLDADLAVDLAHVDAALATLAAGADVVIGSRALPDARVVRPQGWLRRRLGGLYRQLAVRRLGLDVTDVTCGFKAWRRESARPLFAAARAERWGLDAELLYLARRAGLRVAELPVTWRDGAGSHVRLWHDGVGALRELAAVRRRHGHGVVPATPARVS